MSKKKLPATEQLNNLFVRWQSDFPEYQGKFVKDGIINETDYKDQKIRVLFIGKEPNDPEKKGGDFREWWSVEIKWTFSRRICEWAYGFLYDFPAIGTLPNDNDVRLKILNSIAFMNLKKIGGGASVDQAVINETVIHEKHLILEEIEIINPHIIVGSVGDSKIWELIFPGIKFVNTGFRVWVAKFNSYKIIHYYHPSYRVPLAMSYCLLGRVYESEIFQQL